MARVNNFVENGGRLCRTLARSVSVDVDPNARKKNFTKFSVFFREVTPDSPSPRKPHIKVGSLSNTAPLNQQPMGVTILAHFGPSLTTHRLTARQHATKADTQGPQAAFGPLDVGCISHTAPLS